jgi:hypothetical protein
MDADLNMMAQKHFKQQGSGEQQSWDLPSRTVTRAGSGRRITGSHPLNETLFATD